MLALTTRIDQEIPDRIAELETSLRAVKEKHDAESSKDTGENPLKKAQALRDLVKRKNI